MTIGRQRLRASACPRHPEDGQIKTYTSTGSTSDLIKRTWEHKNKVTQGFTAQYNVHMLVYYEIHTTYVEAARREIRMGN